MKRLWMIILASLMLCACVPTPENPIVVQKDTDRLTNTVLLQDQNQIKPIDTSDLHYTYEYESENKRLTVHANADVSVPESRTNPMAKVKMIGHSDELVKKIFNQVFAGKTAYLYNPDAYTPSKQEIANDIAYYQNLVDTGRTDDKLLTEEEALAFIEELKEAYKNAPDESSIADPIISDGTLQFHEYDTDYGKMYYYGLQADSDDATLSGGRVEFPNGIVAQSNLHYSFGESISYAESSEGRMLDWYGNRSHTVSTDDTACAYGQSFSPVDAVKTCLDFLNSAGVYDVAPIDSCDVFVASSGSTLYLIDFVRTVGNTKVAYVPLFQSYNGTDGYEYPWIYENIRFLIDDSGILEFGWNNPVDVQQVLSENVQTISYEQAIRIFEKMCSITYEAQTTSYDNVPVFFDLYVDHIELSLIRIREQNAEVHTGLYVPAWIFYGKCVKQYQQHTDINPDEYLESILFIINAVDGSIIDIEKGY